MRRTIAALALCLAPGVQCALGAEDGELSLGAGLTYSTGTYGTPNETKILAIPFTARYDTAPWIFKLTVPFLHISGSGDVIPGLGQVNNSNSRGRGRGGVSESVSGPGDTVASATYNTYYNSASKLGLDLTGRLKLPTGDADRGLGTGSTDESFQADLYKTFDRVTLFGDLGYTFFGHSEFIELKNGLNYGVGASYKLDATDSAGLSLDGRQRVTPGGPPQRELTAFWNRRIDKVRRIQAYFLVGLENGSPDWGMGVSAAYSF